MPLMSLESTELTVKFHNDVISSNFTVVREYVPIYIIVVHFLIMTILFGTTVAIHVVTMVYRNSSIKASSPNVNYLAYARLYILFVDAMIVTTRDGFPINKQAYGGLCNVSNFTIYAGITLLLGTICAKTWQLYRIFMHLEPGYFLRSRFLIAFTLLLVSVDIVLRVLWTAIDPMEAQTSPANTSNADENGKIMLLLTASRATELYG